jgi:eukaryotic-like serine/threonine-protein kinase
MGIKLKDAIEISRDMAQGTREVIARFEAERQALAMMDHPNIARVLDAGTTSPGRPCFVMELVRGIRINPSPQRACFGT